MIADFKLEINKLTIMGKIKRFEDLEIVMEAVDIVHISKQIAGFIKYLKEFNKNKKSVICNL